MPCVVPTCGTTEGTFRLFPCSDALSERWQEAILVGCGTGMDVPEGGELAASEICQWHFTVPDPEVDGGVEDGAASQQQQYQEPFCFMNCDGEFVEVASCRMCLRFYRAADMVPSEGALGDGNIRAIVYQAMSICFLDTDFLERICQECLTKIELLNSVLSYFSESEDAFQELAKLAKESENQIHSIVKLEHPSLDTFIEEERAESSPEPGLVEDIIVEGSSSDEWEPDLGFVGELPKRILQKWKAEGEEEVSDAIEEVVIKFLKEKAPGNVAVRAVTSRKCYICVTVLTNPNELVKHLTEVHATKTSYRCEECQLDFAQIAPYNRHLARHDITERPHKCTMCPIRFSSSSQMKIHQNKVHGTSHKLKPNVERPDTHVCETCGKVFSVKSKLVFHVRTVHKKDNVPTCNICNKQFTAKFSLERHMLLHSNEKPHNCDQCGASFRRALVLRHHVQKVHAGKNPHVCAECGQEFRSYTALYNHKQYVHLKKPPPVTPTRAYKLICALCRAPYKKTSQLTAHIEEVHPNEIYPYAQCPSCPRTFLSRHYLAFHKEVHTDKYACDVCGLRNATIQRLHAHIENKHSKLRKYDCPICIVKSYKTSAALRRHVQMHNEARAFECEFCKKTFSRKDQMVIHRRTHTGEKPFQCPNCLKKFSDDGTFCRHKKRCRNIVPMESNEDDEEGYDLLDDEF